MLSYEKREKQITKSFSLHTLDAEKLQGQENFISENDYRY